MGCSYHHSGNGAFETNGIAHLGRRPDVVKQIHVDTVCRKNLGGDTCKFLAVVTRIVRNANLRILHSGPAEYVVSKSLCRHADSVLVHSVGSYTHNAAQATGAELQILVECILQSCRVAVAQLKDLHFGLLVVITFQPGHCSSFELFHFLSSL